MGKKLQSQKRMSGAAFSQLSFNSVSPPFVSGTHRHKIQSKATDDTFFSQTPAYLCSFAW